MTEPISSEILEIQGDDLSAEQATRVAALDIARPLLTHNGLASKTPPDVSDLIRLAAWIVNGEDEPLYPYTDSEAVLHLGPRVWLTPSGDLWANGNLYEPSSDDGHDEDSQGPENA